MEALESPSLPPGDDEVDHTLYDKNHPSGSAYFDIEILQTPVLEAFTNNGSFLKSKLISVSRTNILYLPVPALAQPSAGRQDFYNGSYLVAVDENTQVNGQTITNALNMRTAGFFMELVDLIVTQAR